MLPLRKEHLKSQHSQFFTCEKLVCEPFHHFLALVISFIDDLKRWRRLPSHNVCSDIMPVSLGENREPSDQQVLQLDCQCCWAHSNNLQHGNKHTADTEVIQSWESFVGIYVAKCPPAPQKKCSVRLVLCWLYRQLKLSLRGLLLFKTNKGGN